MNSTVVRYNDYDIEIPDGLLRDFKVLSTVLRGIELEDPIEIYACPHAMELIYRCNEAVFAAIGKACAHNVTIGDALTAWRDISDFERTAIIMQAAAQTDPLDLVGPIETGNQFGSH